MVGTDITDLEAKKIVRSIEYERWQSIAKIAIDLTSVEEFNRLISLENDRAGLRSKDVPIKP